MSRRRNVSSSSATPEDTLAPQKLPNRALQLSTELVYTILAICIGDYLSDMMLYPSRIVRWDACLIFLHVSHTFRSCTIKLLHHLWRDTFIHERTRSVSLSYTPHPLTGVLVSLETTNLPTLFFAACHAKHAIFHLHSPLQTINRSCAPCALYAIPYPHSRVFGQSLFVTPPLPVLCSWAQRTTACMSTLKMYMRRVICRQSQIATRKFLRGSARICWARSCTA